MSDIAEAARNALRKQLNAGMVVNCMHRDGDDYTITPRELLGNALTALSPGDASDLVLFLMQGEMLLAAKILRAALAKEIDDTVRDQVNDWLKKEVAA